MIVAGMLGVALVATHFTSEHARTGDGEIMSAFGQEVRRRVGQEELLTFYADKIALEVYLGRFGTRIPPWVQDKETAEQTSRRFVEQVNAAYPDIPYLVTTDRGLIYVGAASPDAQGSYRVRVKQPGQTGEGQKVSIETYPQQLGEVIVSSAPVESQKWGRLYLIRLRRPVAPSGVPMSTGYIPYAAEDQED